MDSNEDSIQLNVTKFDLDTRKGSWRFVSIFIWAGSGLAGLAMLADSFPKAVNFFGVFLLLLCAISIIPLFVFLIVNMQMEKKRSKVKMTFVARSNQLYCDNQLLEPIYDKQDGYALLKGLEKFNLGIYYPDSERLLSFLTYNGISCQYGFEDEFDDENDDEYLEE